MVMRNTDGLAGFSLAAYTEGLDLSSLAPGVSGGEGPARLDGAIRLDASGQSYQALIQAMTGAGDVTVVNARVPGIPETILKPLLAAADKPDFKPQADTTATFEALSKGNGFDVAKASSEFTVNGGTLKLSPVEIIGGDTRLTVDASLGLADLGLGGSLTLAIDPGLDRVAGAEPMVTYGLSGSLAAPKLDVDARALTNYISVRRLEREQARVEALQESLEEKLRLRREGRFYRWRVDTAERLAQAAEARRKAAEDEAKAIEEERARKGPPTSRRHATRLLPRRRPARPQPGARLRRMRQGRRRGRARPSPTRRRLRAHWRQTGRRRSPSIGRFQVLEIPQSPGSSHCRGVTNPLDF